EKVSPEADIYAFGIIVHEMLGRRGPFCAKDYEFATDEEEEEWADQVLSRVRAVPDNTELAFRPSTDDIEVNNEIIEIMEDCWYENAAVRPKIETVRSRFKMCKKFKP